MTYTPFKIAQHCSKAALTILCAVMLQGGTAQAQEKPSLLITAGPIPESLRQSAYSKPVEIREITAKEITGDVYYVPGGSTLVTQRIAELGGSLQGIQNNVGGLANALNALQDANNTRAAEYYASVATINTQLQSGSTPGNPRLVRRLSAAEQSLEALNANATQLNELGVQIANTASEASFLLESTRAAYSLSGAIEEDHIRLAEVEDQISGTIVIIERILNTVNDDITRTSSYLASERNNIRTLALAVTNGDLYGKSLRNRPFSGLGNVQYASTGNIATDATYIDDGANGFGPQTQGTGLAAPRPLAKIKFDRPDVNYEQPVFLAVNQALERYPNARFDLVAVNPSSGNAAEVAIETTRARRNAEKVLRTLTQLGLGPERIDLSSDQSDTAASSEVHLFVK